MVNIMEKAKKDFKDSGLADSEWTVFWLAYKAAIKRFGSI